MGARRASERSCPVPEGGSPRRRLARIPSPPAPAAGGQGTYGRGCGGHRSGCARRTRRPAGPKPEHADPPLRSRTSRPAGDGRARPAAAGRAQPVAGREARWQHPGEAAAQQGRGRRRPAWQDVRVAARSAGSGGRRQPPGGRPRRRERLVAVAMGVAGAKRRRGGWLAYGHPLIPAGHRGRQAASNTGTPRRQWAAGAGVAGGGWGLQAP